MALQPCPSKHECLGAESTVVVVYLTTLFSNSDYVVSNEGGDK
jgi:hypothetical protein